MKKAYLTPVVQNDYLFYTMVEDPRIIAEMIPQVDEKQVQEFQRPWVKSRVKEISAYVAGRMPVKTEPGKEYKAKGLIPNAPILNIKDSKRLPLLSETDARRYLLLPTNKSEFDVYRECIEVIDGQHRVRAFSEEFRSQYLKDTEEYEMVFTVFYQASRNLKNELFMVTNEKQKTVEANLLRWFKKELNLLGEEEAIYDFVVYKLNAEDASPLHGRIAVGAEKISKGYKETQVEKILYKYRVWEALRELSLLSKSNDPQEVMFKTVCNYLKAWEEVCEISFQEPAGTATKISGLRYILVMLPNMLGILKDEKKGIGEKSFEELVRSLPAAIKEPDINEVSDVFIARNAEFRGETATVALAKDHGKALEAYRMNEQGTFNPMDHE